MAYGILDLIRMSRDIKGKGMARTQGLMSGKINPWDLPEWRGQVEGLRTQGDLGMESLGKNLTMSGVTGPAAGLALEKGQEGVNDQTLNLANLMRNDWRQGEGEASSFVDMILQMIQKQTQFDKQMQAEKMKQIGGNIMSGIGMFAGGVSGGMAG